MTRDEHFLTCLAEECAEVAQRVSKALRFGLAEVQRDQPLNNRERIMEEMRDLWAVLEILEDEGVLPKLAMSSEDVDRKRAKIERYFAISRASGTLIETVP